MDRRAFIGTVAAGLAATRRALSRRVPMKFIAVGQALIVRDLAAQKVPGFADHRAPLRGADVVF